MILYIKIHIFDFIFILNTYYYAYILFYYYYKF